MPDTEDVRPKRDPFAAHTTIPSTESPGLLANMSGYQVEVAVRVNGTIAKLFVVPATRAEFDAALRRPVTPDDTVTVTARVSPAWNAGRETPWDNQKGPQ